MSNLKERIKKNYFFRNISQKNLERLNSILDARNPKKTGAKKRKA